MKQIILCTLTLFLFTNANAACNADGCYEYQYEDGTPVPPGSQVMMLKDDEGNPAPQYRGQKVKVVWSSRIEKDYSTKKIYEADEYKKANLQLLAYLYGAKEIGEKSCSPESVIKPKSLNKWFDIVKSYLDAEVQREALYKSERTRLGKVLDTVNSQALQTQTIQTQIDLMNVSINTISGNNGRIPLREKLIEDLKQVIETSKDEDKKLQDIYKKFVNEAIASSLEIATKACDRKKEINECAEDGSCIATVVDDPVKGCKEAISAINEIKSNPLEQYKNAYLAKTPSTELNKKMEGHETEMKKIISSMPEGSDGFDWKSSIVSSFEAMEKTRKENGVRCPAASVQNKNSEQITQATSNYLNSVGVTGLYQDDLVYEFQNSWGKSDILIGQSAFRKDYFETITNLLKRLIEKDKKDLETLLANKAKMEKYLADFKNGLESGSTTTVGGRTTSPTPSSPSPSNSNSNSGSSGSSGSGSSSSGSSSSGAGQSGSDKPKETTSTPPRTFKEILGKAEEKQLKNYTEKFAKKNPNVLLSIKKECPPKPQTPKETPVCETGDISSPWCRPNSEAVQYLARYNACIKAVNEFNAKINAQLNLSEYVKKHPEYVGIEKDPSDQVLKAKMKKSDGTFYYLPLNYTE